MLSGFIGSHFPNLNLGSIQGKQHLGAVWEAGQAGEVTRRVMYVSASACRTEHLSQLLNAGSGARGRARTREEVSSPLIL